MSIETVFRDFLNLKWWDCFEHDFLFVYRGLVHEERAYVENGELVVERKCDHLDLALVSEIDRFVDELSKWSEAVRKIADQWKDDNWEKFVCFLPKDLNYREVFGDYCDALDEIRSRARRILKHLPEKKTSSPPDEPLKVEIGIPLEYRTKAMSKIEALNYIGWPAHARGDEKAARRWLNQSIQDGAFTCAKTASRKRFYWDKRQFPKECQKEISQV